MDYKQEMFYRTPDQNMSKMPFYMAYPMQTVYLEEMEYDRDMQKLKDLYPKEVRTIQEMVEDECDKMEYDGSLMFDEYPDRLMLNQVVKRIYDGVSVSQQDIQNFEAEQYETGRYETGRYEAEQYEAGQFEEDDMQAEELPLEGNLVAQRRQPRPGRQEPWGPGRPSRPGWDPGRPPRRRDDGLNNLIEVLLFNEMHRRRCRHKRCRRWW